MKHCRVDRTGPRGKMIVRQSPKPDERLARSRHATRGHPAARTVQAVFAMGPLSLNVSYTSHYR